MAHFSESIAQCVWPKERVSTRLCIRCGNSFQLDLHELKYNETTRRVRSGYSAEGLSERAVYSKLLDDAQTDLDRCQSELRRLQDLSREIEAHQKLLEAYMAGIRCIMSPIRKLPQEMLGEIFQYVCCDGIGSNHILEDGKPRLPTLTLSHVCIRWYNLVTSMPVLWSSFGSKAQFTDTSTLSLFNMFLQRSHSHPIDFRFDFTRSETFFAKAFVEESECLSFLTASGNTDRWHHVQIATNSSSAIKKTLQSLIDGRQNLPVLVSLELHATPGNTLSFPVDCPRLRSLTLNSVPLDLEYPRSMVTYLNLMCLSPEETLRLIRCCPNIQMLVVRQPVEKEEEVTAPTNISCDTAKFTVGFGVHDRRALSEIFDSAAFPELTHLELFVPKWLVIGPQNDQVASLCSMLKRSHCSRLTHLTIHFIPFISAGLLRLFLSVPSVMTLEVKEPPFHDRTLYLVLKSLVATDERDAQTESPEGKSRKKLENHCGVSGGEEDIDEDGDEHDGDGGSSIDEDSDGEGSVSGSSEEDSDGEDDITVPEGQCLLPQLKDLTVAIESYDYSELLLKVVRSRWRLDDSQHPQACDSSGAEACVCLQKLRIHAAPRIDQASFETLQRNMEPFRHEGMDVEVIRVCE